MLPGRPYSAPSPALGLVRSPFNGIFLCTGDIAERKIPNAILICGQAQMKSAVAVCTCIAILYLLDAAFFNGVYFADASRMLSDMLSHFR